MEGMKGVATLLLVIVVATFVATEKCVNADDPQACVNLLDGDYTACADCEKGAYTACAPYGPQKMNCPLGNYYKDGQVFIAANLVFDPDTKNCEYKSTSCPRPDIDPYAPRY